MFTFFSEYEILRQYVQALIVVDPRGGGPMASSNDIGRCLRLFGRLECLELAHVPVQLIISALRHCPRIRQMELRACTIGITDASLVLLRLPQLRMLSIVECTLIQGENRPPGFSWFAPGVLEAVKAWRLCNIHALAVVESHRYNAGLSVLAWIPTLGSRAFQNLTVLDVLPYDVEIQLLNQALYIAGDRLLSLRLRRPGMESLYSHL